MHISMTTIRFGWSRIITTKGLAGNFVGVDPSLKNGLLTFSQKFVRKPVSSWRDGKLHTLEVVSDNVLKFSWQGGGTENFTRVKK